MLFKDFSQSINPYKSKRVKLLKKQLQHAESYEEWKATSTFWKGKVKISILWNFYR